MNAPFRQRDYDNADKRIAFMSDVLSAMESNYAKLAAQDSCIRYATPVAISRYNDLATRLEKLAALMREGSEYMIGEWNL